MKREKQKRKAWQQVGPGFRKIKKNRNPSSQNLEQVNALVQLILDMGEASNESDSIVDAFKYALERVVGFLGWPLGHALLMEGDDDIAHAQFWAGDASEALGEFIKASEALHFRPGFGLPGRVQETGQPVWVNDLASHPHIQRGPAAERAGLNTALALPVLAGKKVVGVLEFFQYQRIPPDQELLKMLGYIGVQLGRVVECKHSQEALRKATTQLRMVVSSLPLFVLALDRTGKVLILEGKGISGTTLAERSVVGQNVFEALAYRPDVLKFVHQALAGEKIHTEVVSETGTFFEMYFTPYYDVNWAVDGVFMLGFDVSERERMENDLEEIKHRLLDSIDHERMTLARQLHDGPLQDLYGAYYQIQDLSAQLAEDAEGQETLRRVLNIIEQVNGTLREIVGELHPNTLVHLGLSRAIQSHAEQTQERHAELKIYLSLEDDEPWLPDATRLGLFRVYQQLIRNAVTHSEARHIWVRLRYLPEEIVLEVQDNGKGFPVPENWIELVRLGKVGLVNVQERLERLNGHMEILSGPVLGTTIRIHVPRKAGEH